MSSLFVLDLTYVADLSEVDRLLEPHREYLARNYDAGVFLASGRKEPRTGGVILATGDRRDVEAVVRTDPFAVHGVATYEITEFVPTMTAPVLEEWRRPAG
jgi:uncharacterized protein YciI